MITTRFVAIGLALLVPASAAAQQQPTPEQMRAMAEKSRPGPEHGALASLEGRWTVEVTYNAGASPMKSAGTATNRMILGGRFLLSEHTTKMPPNPMSEGNLQAMSIYGFDRRTNEYTIVEFDSMGTYWVSAAGPASPGKDIVMSGETLDDHSGQREMRQYDMVLRVLDPNTYITQIVFKFPNRKPLALVEMVHRRVQ